ncbi:nitrogen regulation protein NR(II) [Thermodesulfobacteriota bacterium]
MTGTETSIINIAVIGGSSFCKELLEKTTLDYKEKEVSARMKAVADPDSQSPGMLIAKKLGLITVSDYHDLYNPSYDIQLFIILTPEQSVLEEILETKPSHIRVQSYNVFNVFWKAISIEERKLRQRNEEVETIINGIQDLISVINPDLEIIDVNEAILKHMGLTKNEVIGKKCYQVFHDKNEPCNADDFTCPLREVVSLDRPVRRIQPRKHRNGETRYHEITVFPIWGKDGRISEFIDISRDITSRLKEEEEMTRRLEEMVEERTKQLQETHAKLLHQDKMASLGKLAASVVHEINNPIAGVLNFTMLMKRMIDDGPPLQRDIDKFKQYLDLMEAETKRTSRIVSNLLTFSRQSKIEPGRININMLIEHTLIVNSNLLKINNIMVETKLDSSLPDIIGSSDQLQQVFMNFISNAAEAMEPHGQGVLRVETEHHLNGNHNIVRFKDSGTGIPREDATKIFEPFFTKKKGKGIGLGLSVAYGIIKEHGGVIDVTSDTGKGTTIEIVFPLRNDSVNPDFKE